MLAVDYGATFEVSTFPPLDGRRNGIRVLCVFVVKTSIVVGIVVD